MGGKGFDEVIFEVEVVYCFLWKEGIKENWIIKEN